MPSMRTTLTILLAALLAPPAFAAGDCKQAPTQAAMNQCAGQDYQREDAGLNKSYKELVARTDPRRRVRLKQVQLAWLAYRDLHCNYQADQYQGGSMAPLVRATCLAALTRQRKQELVSMVKEAAL